MNIQLHILSSSKFILIAFSCIILGTSSCKKLLDRPTSHASIEELQWTSIADTRSSVTGMYGLMRAALADNYRFWMYGEMRMGDFVPYKRSDYQQIRQNRLKGAYPVLEELADWRRFYAVINAASVLIEHAPQVLEKDPLYSEQNLVYDIAQARALRAFVYFYMVRIWGDVPLITEAYDNGSFPHKPRTDAGTVLAYAGKELQEVIPDLPYRYGTSGQLYYGQNNNFWDGILLNKIAAYAILAHIAAWQSNYVNVEVYTKFIMDNYTSSGIDYTNISNLSEANGFFSRTNNTYKPRQVISFAASDADGESTQFGHIESLTLASPLINKEAPEIYVPKDSINTIFRDLFDLRFGLDTATKVYRTNYFTNYSSEMPVFSKIKIIRGGVSDPSFSLFASSIVFTRLEELVLLRAEAFAALNRKAEAMTALNIIRNARGLDSYSDRTPVHIVDAVFEERRRELMGEGWRWFDQVRHDRIMRSNAQLNELIDNGGIYWPVAAGVLKENDLLIQNNYWK